MFSELPFKPQRTPLRLASSSTPLEGVMWKSETATQVAGEGRARGEFADVRVAGGLVLLTPSVRLDPVGRKHTSVGEIRAKGHPSRGAVVLHNTCDGKECR